MKKQEIEKIFSTIEERFDFEFRNASDIEDLKERIERAVAEIKENLEEATPNDDEREKYT